MAVATDVGEKARIPEVERILLTLSLQNTTPTGRVQSYRSIQELLEPVDDHDLKLWIDKDMQHLCRCIQRDVMSNCEDIAPQALKILGFLLHRPSFVSKLPDDEACKFLLTVLALITTTSNKLVCSLALWCIAVQELKTSLLKTHLNMIIDVVLHGIDNPLGSMGITYEAFQALIQLSKQLPGEMRDFSSSWAPPVYQKLLNCNAKMLAENCLSAMQSVLLPPPPNLSKVVAADINRMLLSKMEVLIKSEGRKATVAVQAWAWFVKLLGASIIAERSLINVMLRLLERSFVSTCVEVRAASQVAWVSIIDACVQFPSAGQSGKCSESSTSLQLSSPRLKLLLTPLLNTMSWDKDMRVQRSCYCTWMYLLCKLRNSVNERRVFEVTVVPMLELVFKLGPKYRDPSVWQACVELLTNIIACRKPVDTSLDAQAGFPTGAIQSPKTPVGITYAGIFSGSHHQNISWSSWQLDRLNSLLNMFRLLLTCSLQQLDEGKHDNGTTPSANRSLEACFECWRLLVTGVDAGERDVVRPSSEHIAAVHLLLQSFSGTCTHFRSKRILSTLWQLADVLIDILRPVVVASSFYKISVQLADLPSFTAERIEDNGQHVDSSPLNMVTPIVYLSAAWFKLVFDSSDDLTGQEMWSQAVEKLLTTGRAGFDVMGNYHGFMWILSCLGDRWSSRQEESRSSKVAFLGDGLMTEAKEKENWHFLMAVWRSVAEKLTEYVERSNDVPPVGSCQRDSGYQVVSNVLLFPFKCFLMDSLREYHALTAELAGHESSGRFGRSTIGILEAELQIMEGPWFKLFDSVSRVSSLRNPQPNSFTSECFSTVVKVMIGFVSMRPREVPGKTEILDVASAKPSDLCLRFLGHIVAHAMEHAEISTLAMLAISRKRRKTGCGSSSVRVQCIAGMELDDANNLKQLLTAASRLLTLSYEKYELENKHSSICEPVLRVLGALANLMQHISSQSDSVLLLQALTQPMMCWFKCRRHLSGMLLEGLARAWDGLLLSLQSCRPCLVFDSNLLLVQTPALAPAFLHSHDAISNRTLAFWESTYGAKAVTLDYPPEIVEVLCTIKDKVSISLPGWKKKPAIVVDSYLDNSSRQPFATFTKQTEGRIQSMMNMLHGKRGLRELCPGPDRDVSRTSMQHSATIMLSSGSSACDDIKETQCPVVSADSTLETTNELIPTSDTNAVVEAPSNMDCAPPLISDISRSVSPDDAAITLDPGLTELVALNEVNMAEEVPSPIEIADPLHTAAADVLMTDVRQLASARRDQEGVVGEQEQGSISAGISQGTPTLVTPLAFNEVPFVPPKKPAGTERPQGVAKSGDFHVPAATGPTFQDRSKGADGGSKLPGRRKKLKFQDDSEEIEYVVIPQSQKKKGGPLTDRQREVRSSQRSGKVVKTYTAADFSQSNGYDLVDSQAVDPSEGAYKENISANLLRLEQTICEKSTEIEEVNPPVFNSQKVGKEFMKTIPLDEVDFVQLKDRLTILWQENPDLPFHEAFNKEKYDRLPRVAQNRLRSHLHKLNKQERIGNASLSKVEREPPGLLKPLRQKEDAACCKEIVRTAKRPVHRVVTTRRTVHRPSSRGDADPVDCGHSGEEIEERIRSNVLVRRQPDLHCLRSVSIPFVNLRNSGKLRDGKQWRKDAEAVGERTLVTARPGNKKIVAKRQRQSSLVSKRAGKMPAGAGVDRNVVQSGLRADSSVRTKQVKIPNHKVENSTEDKEQVQVHEEPSQSENFLMVNACTEPTGPKALERTAGLDLSKLQFNSPFRVRNLNRGLLATVFSVHLSADSSSDDKLKAHFSQGYTRANHNPRKCRAPKRIPSLNNSCERISPSTRTTIRIVTPSEEAATSGTSKEASRLEEATTSGLSKEVLCSVNADSRQPSSPLDLEKGDMSHSCESPPLLVCILSDDPIRQDVEDVNCFLQDSKQRSSCADADVPKEADFRTPEAFIHPVGLDDNKAPDIRGATIEVTAEGLGLHSPGGHEEERPQPSSGPLLPSKKQVLSEIQILLEKGNVQVTHVLNALLEFSKCQRMGKSDVVQAEKLLSELRQVIVRRPSRRQTLRNP